MLLVVLAAGGYAAFTAGKIYFRAYAFEDEIRQSARFASQSPDSTILKRLALVVDSLGLPHEARNVTIQRVRGTVTLSAEYTELLDLTVWRRVLRFRPRAESTL